ncbi:MAG: adenylate/guanylate cyclase domain-containing protein [Xanthobacteraceae bacterium]
MKRKIAAILAADIAGYSRLVAEDEEETLRRLQAYREVVDDFITKASGRIFNTAGDAVLAEFASAVEAVRCAIDIQESLRTRNRAYPPSRQMSFRIGITIGDVVERNGDLLGDGVNIAARLEGIAPVGGICVSRTVYEQVANKLSVQFADIGEQQVKNIPNPIHAFTVAMHGEGGQIVPPSAKAGSAKQKSSTPLIGALAGVVALLVAVFIYFEFIAPGRAPISAATAPEQRTVAAAPSGSGPASTGPAALAPPLQATTPEKLVPETIPVISDRSRLDVRNEYLPAPGHKAIAFSVRRIAFLTSQADDETAAKGALDSCQRATDAIRGPPQKCEVFAIGDVVVSSRAHPPMPPQPWIVRDASVEKPLTAKDIPLIPDSARTNVERNYMPALAPKAIALSPRGHLGFFVNQSSVDEASRRALEFCGGNAGVPCTIIGVDNAFIVPIPTTMKISGFFRPAASTAIAAGQRDEIAKQFSENATGWSAIAIGDGGHAGVSTKAASEADAVSGASAECRKSDQNCRVIAIGMFAVEPN